MDMNFQTDTVASSFDATSGMNAMQGERNAQRSNVFEFAAANSDMQGYSNNGFRDNFLESRGIGGSNNSVVGINVNEINSMVNAITEYCEAIENYIQGLNPAADSELAFKGEEVKAALNAYMDNVKLYCVNLVSQLLAFNDKLRDVRNQWQQYTANLAGNIGSASGRYSTGSRYNESIQ